MTSFLLAIPWIMLAADTESRNPSSEQFRNAWSARYQQIKTVEYVLEGTELLTPEFLVGIAQAPDSFVVMQRPVQIVCRIDFPQKRIYIHHDYYQWQVHLERFVRRIDQVYFDEAHNQYESQTEFVDKALRAKHSQSPEGARNIAQSVEFLPVWMSNGVIPFLGNCTSLFAYPDYAAGSSTHWSISPGETGAIVRQPAYLDVRQTGHPLRYRCLLDSQTGWLPHRIAFLRSDCTTMEMSVSYVEDKGTAFPDKWEVTSFSTKGKIERSINLSCKSRAINEEISDELFRIQRKGG
jgi:hypothetical protein